MAEYMDREALFLEILLDKSSFVGTSDDVQKHDEQCDYAISCIFDAPAADVAPVVHGKWKYYHKQNKAVCTRCSLERDLDENFGAAISCPNCGAKTDGDDSNAAD